MRIEDTSRTKAKSLAELPNVLGAGPLNEESWTSYVETDEARGDPNVPRLMLALENASHQERPEHVLLSGHQGCGKSTELHRIRRQLRSAYDCNYVDVENRLSIPTVDYRQVLFCCAQVLVERAEELDADLEPAQIKTLVDWFDSTTIQETQKQGSIVSAEAGGEIKFLRLLFTKVSGKIFSGGETLQQTTRYIESRLDSLVSAMGIVVAAIEQKLFNKKVLLLLDGLDKIERFDQGRELFFEHRRQLLDIPCSTIFTFPIRLWYDSDPGLMSYPCRYILPMIPVEPEPFRGEEAQRRAEEKARRCRDKVEQIVLARLAQETELFAPEALSEAVLKSGGVLRDLFLILREAALDAQLAKQTRVESKDVRRAARKLRNEYANRLSPGGKSIPSSDIYDTIGKLEDWPRHTVEHTSAFGMLLQSLCIIAYNGEVWYGLHPLLREHLVKAAEEREERKRRREA